MKIETLSALPDSYSAAPGLLNPVALRPLQIAAGVAATRAVNDGLAKKLAGGPLAFGGVEIFVARGPDDIAVCVTDLPEFEDWHASLVDDVARSAVADAWGQLVRPRSRFAGLDVSAPVVMGILNVTPDSFYADSRVDPDQAIETGLAMVADGAAILDIGGESTRPGSKPTEEAEELARVIPVISGLRECGAAISVDTRRASVMAAAIEAGAGIVNDVTALSDPDAFAVLRDHPEVGIVLMHSQGAPATMQDNPRYTHAPYEIFTYLSERVSVCAGEGIARDRIAVDPGFGFGKTVDHNRQILASIGIYHGLGCPVLAGLSRKSFLGALSDAPAPEDRLPATLAATVQAAGQGVMMHRVHDVAAVVGALKECFPAPDGRG